MARQALGRRRGFDALGSCGARGRIACEFQFDFLHCSVRHLQLSGKFPSPATNLALPAYEKMESPLTHGHLASVRSHRSTRPHDSLGVGDDIRQICAIYY
jgi:hypothetical protein